MIFEYQSKIYLGEVALYVANLARQKDFYQRVLGLELLEEDYTQVALGRDGQVLVRLLATSDRQPVVKSAYGLYHLALLLPSRQALADILKHLSEIKSLWSEERTTVIVKPFIWRIQKAMALSFIGTSLRLIGIFGKTVALSE